MKSLARAHFERCQAAQAAALAGVAASAGLAPPMPTEGEAASAYQQQLIALGEDLRQLHQIQSLERKIEAKRAMIDRYRPWLAGALSAETAAQDDIVTTMLVWAIDIAEWPLALDLAAHVLTHRLALPERYKRAPAVLIAEEVAEAGLRKPPAADLATLRVVDALTEEHDMPDQVRAKLMKAIGLGFRAALDAFDPEAESAVAGGRAALLDNTLAHFTRALQLDGTCGVKKAIEVAERERAKLIEAAQAGAPA